MIAALAKSCSTVTDFALEIKPAVASGNTNAATIMIAEKAADIILGKPALSGAA